MAIIGEMRVFAFNFAPLGWLSCAGQTLNASDYPQLFALIGNTFGGNATEGTFNLPDLRSRVMINTDPDNAAIKTPGATGGAEAIILTPETSAPHSHSFNIGSTPDAMAVEGASIAQSVAMDNSGTVLSFAELAESALLNEATIGNSGGGTAHENRMPSIALNVCIAATDDVIGSGALTGEIRPFAFKNGPEEWLPCDGSLLQIQQYEVLQSLLQTTFGGDGQTTFGLPDLRGKVVVAAGQGTNLSGYALGQTFGTESVSLTIDEMPSHQHQVLVCNDTAVSAVPQGEYTYLAARECPVTGSLNSFIPANPTMQTIALHPDTIGTGSGGAHENRQPFVAINYMICSNGSYPMHR